MESTLKPSELDPSDEELLQSALSTSFTRLPSPPPPPAPSEAPEQPSDTSTPASIPPIEPSSANIIADPEESWKEDYERHLAAWRAEADVARAKAERTRAEWEVRRQAEEEEERLVREELLQKEKDHLAGWETVSPADETNLKPVLPAEGEGEARAAAPSTGEAEAADKEGTASRLSAAQAAISQHVSQYGPDSEVPSPSPADVRDLVTGEKSRSPGIGLETISIAAGLETGSTSTVPVLETAITQASSVSHTGDAPSEEDEPRISKHWEEVPSLASSFPSLPENVSLSSFQEKGIPETEEHPTDHYPSFGDIPPYTRSHQVSHPRRQPPADPSLTASIFGHALTPRARVMAIFSYIAINMLLPFVNGVMLGFGEIFARNVVGPFFGWKPPGGVGIRLPTRGDRAGERRR